MDKICRRCQVSKSIKKFKTDNRQKDGTTVTCRECYEKRQLTDKKLHPLTIENIRKSNTGKKHSLERRLAISKGQKKAVEEGRHHWKKKEISHKDQDRTHIEYKLWREDLLTRAKNKCEDCGSNKRLHAHHIQCFYKNPESRFLIENGKILCQSCHSKLHKTRDKTGRKKNY